MSIFGYFVMCFYFFIHVFLILQGLIYIIVVLVSDPF